MKLLEGEMSIFDLDSKFGRTSPEPCRAESRKEKISASSSRSARESKTQVPLYLDLRKENGRIVDASWEMGGALLGQYGTHSFTESHNGVGESRLSLILEDKVQPKYYLSPRACRGIIERATKRGKLARIPEVLLKALEWQSVEANYQKLVQSLSKNERVSRGGGKGLLIQEEHIGSMKTNDRQSVCYGFDPSGSRDVCAQFYEEYSKTINNGTSPGHHAAVVELRRGGKQPTAKERTPMICLNDQGGGEMSITKNHTSTLRAETHGHPPIVTEKSNE